MRIFTRIVLTLSFCVTLATVPAAARQDLDPIAGDLNYSTGAGKKLGRGIGNLAFGWIEIFKGIQDVGKEHDPVAAVTWGPIYGIGNAVGRTAAGVYEIATFPIPAPAHFEPLVEPEFVLEKS